MDHLLPMIVYSFILATLALVVLYFWYSLRNFKRNMIYGYSDICTLCSYPKRKYEV